MGLRSLVFGWLLRFALLWQAALVKPARSPQVRRGVDRIARIARLDCGSVASRDARAREVEIPVQCWASSATTVNQFTVQRKSLGAEHWVGKESVSY